MGPASAVLVVLATAILAPVPALAPDRDPGATEPAALVLAVVGAVEVEGSGGDRRALWVGHLLERGDRVIAGPEGSALLLRWDGSSLAVTGEKEIPAGEGERDPRFGRVADLLLRFRDRPADPGPPDSPPEGPHPLAPANGIPVRNLTPVLQWRPEAEAEAEVHRIRLWTGEREAVTFEVEGETAVTVPAEQALTPGVVYEWGVEALPGRAVSPRVRFRVLDRVGMDRVAAGLRGLREAGLDPVGAGRLPAVALFHEMNLVYDALEALDGLMAEYDGAVSPTLELLREHLRNAARPVPLPEGGPS